MGIRTLQPRVSVINSLKGVFHQMFGSSCQYAKKQNKKEEDIWTQSDLRFCENDGSNRLKINEKGVNWIGNQGATKSLKSVK